MEADRLRLTPPFPEFSKQCRPGARVPVWVEIPLDTETPVSAYLKLARPGESAFLFESVEGGERIGRYSFMGVRPRRVLEWNDADLETGERVFQPLRASLKRKPAPKPRGMPPFLGGFVGFVTYDAVRVFEPRVPVQAEKEHAFPAALWMDVDTVVTFDHVRHTAILSTEVDCAPGESVNPRRRYAQALETLMELIARLRAPYAAPTRPAISTPAKMAPRITRKAHESAVKKAIEYIRAGDCQQIVLSQRFDANVELEPIELYRSLRRVNPSPYLFLLQHGDLALVGSSPETLIRLSEGEVTLRPIAGTRKRGTTPEEDAALEAELRADPKENAEHVMLVDLGRNDVGRVSKVGSVKLETFKTIERYSHVMHLVSEVRGRIAPGFDAFDVLRAGFPAGTVSGSPKVRAMEIIGALERTRRGPYAGSVGWIDRYGNMEMAIAIRTFMQSGRRLSVQAGGGVVFDSDPGFEYQETLNKAGALFAALAEAQRVRNAEAAVEASTGKAPLRARSA